MTIQERKQLDSLICLELNIHVLVRKYNIKTNSGDIELCYSSLSDMYYIQVGGVEVSSPRTLELLLGELCK